MYTLAVIVCVVGYAAAGPLHASCTLEWTFQITCSAVQTRLADQANAWHTDANCPNAAGEKCLYTIASKSTDKLVVIHETPKHHYKDTVTFTFTQGPSAGTCNVHGFSTSQTWYAILDYGTNYCNMRNLLEGANLNTNGFMETTSNRVCTQYTSRNCNKY